MDQIKNELEHENFISCLNTTARSVNECRRIAFKRKVNVQRGCKKLLPFLNKIVRGLDLSKLDLFASASESDNGFRKTLYEYTCELGNTFTFRGQVRK